MNKRILIKQIKHKLQSLEPIIDKVRNFILDLEDESTWDTDYFSALQINCEKIVSLLEDKVDPKKKDEYGEPLVLEEGILSLLDEYHSEEEEEE